MEITLQHTDEIYKTFFTVAMILPVISCFPAIMTLIKCRYEFADYKLKYKLLWIIPAIFLLRMFLTTGLYMMDYTFDRKDVQTVYVESVRGYNGGCYLFTDNQKFQVSNKKYDSDEHVLFIMEEEVEGHMCEIESYKSWNNVIRIKVLD